MGAAQLKAYQAMLAAQAQAQAKANEARFAAYAGLRNAYNSDVRPKPAPLKDRTWDEIEVELQARVDELKREAEKPERLRPCETCLWAKDPGKEWVVCTNPLIVGFGKPPYVRTDLGLFEAHAKLCGKERVLWEPHPKAIPRWQRFVDWLLSIIDAIFPTKDQ